MSAAFDKTGPLDKTDNWENWDGDKKIVLQALDKSRGIISIAAESSKVGRSTIYRWLEADEEFKAALQEIREAAIDHVEGKLMTLIDGGDNASTMFFLKTRGKKRGYVERTELTGADGEAIKINIIMPKSNEGN